MMEQSPRNFQLPWPSYLAPAIVDVGGAECRAPDGKPGHRLVPLVRYRLQLEKASLPPIYDLLHHLSI